jgi:hypothetical protein
MAGHDMTRRLNLSAVWYYFEFGTGADQTEPLPLVPSTFVPAVAWYSDPASSRGGAITRCTSLARVTGLTSRNRGERMIRRISPRGTPS